MIQSGYNIYTLISTAPHFFAGNTIKDLSSLGHTSHKPAI